MPQSHLPRFKTVFNNGVKKKRSFTRSWAKGFKIRQSTHLMSREEKVISKARKNVPIQEVEEWFGLFEKIVAQYDLTPENILNMDESGHCLGSYWKSVRVMIPTSNKTASVNQVNAYTVFDTIPFVSASGSIWGNAVLVRTKEALGKAIALGPSTYGTRSKAPFLRIGGETSKLDGAKSLDLARWFADVKNKRVGDKHVLLILDNLRSQSTDEFKRILEESNIHVLYLPKSSTHFLQPLDNNCFKQLKAKISVAYSTWLTRFAYNNENSDIYSEFTDDVIETALKEALTSQVIKSSFAACGIWPISPKIALKNRLRFCPTYLTNNNDHHSNLIKAFNTYGKYIVRASNKLCSEKKVSSSLSRLHMALGFDPNHPMTSLTLLSNLDERLLSADPIAKFVGSLVARVNKGNEEKVIQVLEGFMDRFMCQVCLKYVQPDDCAQGCDRCEFWWMCGDCCLEPDVNLPDLIAAHEQTCGSKDRRNNGVTTILTTEFPQTDSDDEAGDDMQE